MKHTIILAAAVFSVAITSVAQPLPLGWKRDSGLRAVDGDFTASFTFRWNGFAPIPKEQAWRNGMIACHRSGYYEGWRLHLHDTREGRPVFEIGRKQGSVSVESGEGLATGVWHRVAVSWQAKTEDPSLGTMRLFADGALVAESPADRPRPQVDASPVMLGYVDFGVGALDFEVADCSLVPKALSEREIAAEFRADPTIADDDPLAHRPLLRSLVTRAERQVAESEARWEKLLAGIDLRRLKVRVKANPLESVSATRDLVVPAGTTQVVANVALQGTSLRLDRTAFAPVADPAVRARFPEAVRDRVVVAAVPGLPDFIPYGVGIAERRAPLVLAAGVKPLPMAAWPDDGSCAQAETKEGTWTITAAGAPQLAAGTKALGYGYWQHYWADAALPIESLGNGCFKLLSEHRYGLGDKPRVSLRGIPEVLDRPGEWCVLNEKLYLLPPEGGFAYLTIPRFKGPLIRARNQQGTIVIRNVDFTGTLDTALELVDCADVILQDVRFAGNAGDDAVIRSCGRVRIVNTSFANTGHTQLRLNGGDRETLTKGEMIVEGCHFRAAGQLQRTYTPCILLEGCGAIISHCMFTDTPSSAMRIEGNDHTIRDCRFERNVLESDDQGAIDLWGNPTYRGNLFFANSFTDVGGNGNNDCGRNGIRFDDMISGMFVVSNTFVNAAQGNFGAVNIHAGHYNLIQGNRFVSCAKGIGDYGWGDQRIAERFATDELKERLSILDRAGVYRERYPELSRLGTDDSIQLILGNRLKTVRSASAA